MDRVRQAAKGIIASTERVDRRDKAVNRILAFKADDSVGRFTLIRLLISAGQEAQDRELVRLALDAFERLKAKAPKDQGLYYDIANGYLELYYLGLTADPGLVFDREPVVLEAIKYFGKASQRDPRVLTNLGNLYDAIGRPVEAINCYERAVRLDSTFGMAWGNKAMAVERLSPVSGYRTTYLIYAHQLYQRALQHSASIIEVGGDVALESFQRHDGQIVAAFNGRGSGDLLEQDLAHEPYNDAPMSDFVKFYTEFCVDHDLYLNLHIYDRRSSASIVDAVLPPLTTTRSDGDEQKRVNDIMFRLNEINESYMTARMALVQSQFTTPDFSQISRQTTLVNTLDYAVSNIYVGHLKMAYKEAFSALDKMGILINHYLGLGRPEDSVYYHDVWFDAVQAEAPPAFAAQVRAQGYRLFGLYLLSQELKGSRFSLLRNAMTHRYLRVYRVVGGPKGTYTFEELTALTIEVMYKVKCAIMYMALFVASSEAVKRKGLGEGLVVQMPLHTGQNLDLW